MQKVIYKKEDGVFKNSVKFFRVNMIYNISIIVSCIIIGSINKSVSRALITGGVLYFWAYFIHIIAHNVYPATFFHGFHHNPEINTTWYAEIIETLVNIFGSGGLSLAIMNMLIEDIFQVKLLDNDVLLFTTFLYTSFHMINYHILKVPTHVKHHENSNTNFGPDIMDILFNTKQDRDFIEDMNHGVINVVIILSLILITKDTKLDIIDNLHKLVTILPYKIL